MVQYIVVLAVVLVIGFGAHNATEGFGIASPLTRLAKRPSVRFLATVGLVGGGPTFRAREPCWEGVAGLPPLEAKPIVGRHNHITSSNLNPAQLGAMAAKGLTVAVVIFLLSSVAVFGYFAGLASRPTSSTSLSSTSSATTMPVDILFNTTTSVGFYRSLMSPLGLFADTNGSHTIWLADDQVLDYQALLSAYDSTHNSTALNLAEQVNSSIAKWGGFYGYWNPVFEVLGSYPSNASVTCGTDQEINVTQGYTIKATVFNFCPTFQYTLFVDQLAYHILLDLREANYTGAESEFSRLSGMWDTHGFSDYTFRTDPTHTYQSYKLADYVIAWKALADNPTTRQSVLRYQAAVQGVAAVMSKLQSPDGGVWTGYRVSNGQLLFGSGVTTTNGETTSLFILALESAISTVSSTSVSCTAAATVTQSLGATTEIQTITLCHQESTIP